MPEAFAYLTKAEALDSSDVEVRLRLASIYLMDRQVDNVHREAEAVLRRTPANREALKLRGIASLQQGKPEQAAQAAMLV